LCTTVFPRGFRIQIEQSAVKARRGENQATLAYFNEILKEGWVFFLEAERSDLRALGLNNTTNAYERTGVFPIDPFASTWTEAIETLGGVENAREREERPKVQYEALAKLLLPEILDNDKKIMREGLTIDPLLDENNLAVALICGGEILSKWRKAIQEAVSEGKNFDHFSRALLPGSTATDNSHRVAMKMIKFKFVDVIQNPWACQAKKGREGIHNIC
jgi:hypothetical protein